MVAWCQDVVYHHRLAGSASSQRIPVASEGGILLPTLTSFMPVVAWMLHELSAPAAHGVTNVRLHTFTPCITLWQRLLVPGEASVADRVRLCVLMCDWLLHMPFHAAWPRLASAVAADIPATLESAATAVAALIEEDQRQVPRRHASMPVFMAEALQKVRAQRIVASMFPLFLWLAACASHAPVVATALAAAASTAALHATCDVRAHVGESGALRCVNVVADALRWVCHFPHADADTNESVVQRLLCEQLAQLASSPCEHHRGGGTQLEGMHAHGSASIATGAPCAACTCSTLLPHAVAHASPRTAQPPGALQANAAVPLVCVGDSAAVYARVRDTASADAATPLAAVRDAAHTHGEAGAADPASHHALVHAPHAGSNNQHVAVRLPLHVWHHVLTFAWGVRHGHTPLLRLASTCLLLREVVETWPPWCGVLAARTHVLTASDAMAVSSFTAAVARARRSGASAPIHVEPSAGAGTRADSSRGTHPPSVVQAHSRGVAPLNAADVAAVSKFAAASSASAWWPRLVLCTCSGGAAACPHTVRASASECYAWLCVREAALREAARVTAGRHLRRLQQLGSAVTGAKRARVQPRTASLVTPNMRGRLDWHALVCECCGCSAVCEDGLADYEAHLAQVHGLIVHPRTVRRRQDAAISAAASRSDVSTEANGNVDELVHAADGTGRAAT
ncbi:hypothetical protein EON67_02650 [archaeon]|nr:MAG: hypothetical protein EON67_02650 [archaeon]